MTSNLIKALAGALALSSILVGSFTASATIIDHPSDHYLTDTAGGSTGLDWLDVTASINMSYDDVSGQFGVGGLFEGWRYATGAEFTTLLLDWGIAAVPHKDNPATQLSLHQSIISTLGVTGYRPQQPEYSYTEGFIADIIKTAHYGALIEASCDPDCNDPSTSTTTQIEPHFGEYLTYQTFPDIGSFLVRPASAVPVPNVGAGLPGLIFAGGYLLAWCRRKRSSGAAAAA